jgi:cytochrome c biogenesis protein ResB
MKCIVLLLLVTFIASSLGNVVRQTLQIQIYSVVEIMIFLQSHQHLGLFQLYMKIPKPDNHSTNVPEHWLLLTAF